ncbi:MAG: O-antigen ligase family protein [Bacteroidota bacterium]
MASFSRPQIEELRCYLTLLMLAGVFFGLVVSPPVLSIGLIGLVVLGLLDPVAGFNPRWRTGIGPALCSPFFWAMSGLYLLLLLGIWQTEDWTYYLERLRIKVPLLALPLIWPGLPQFTGRERGWVYGGFVLFMVVVLALVLGNYALHFTEINGMVHRGQPVPVPRNHIRFSLLVALATLVSVGAYRSRAFGWQRAWLVLTAFLFVGQHFLAVRSGLAGAYGGIGVLVLALAWERGTWWPAVVGLLGLTVLPVLAYVAVPSFRTKMNYARYELFHRDPAKDTAEYSDEGRLTSLRIGYGVWQDHFWLGVGPGNLLRETDRRYAEISPGAEGKRPHNQFLSALAGSGLIGGLITLGSFLVLGWVGVRQRAPVYVAAWTVLFLSCLVENTLETSAGVSMFCVFLLLLSPSAPASPAPDRLPSPPAPSGTGA